MSTNACPRQPVGTNDNQSLLDRIKDISTVDFIGMLNTALNEIADAGYLELYGKDGSLLKIDTRALRNALQGKFIAADIALAYISYKQMISEGNPPEEALGETLASLLGGIAGAILGIPGGALGVAIAGYIGSKFGEWLWDSMKNELGNLFNQIDSILNDSLLDDLFSNKPCDPFIDDLFTNISDLKNKALLRKAIYGDPLVVDLDGDGIETISPANSNIMFDFDGDGFRERTGWVSPDDGILVIDKNNDGQINDVNEVFGNLNMDGFTELSQYDSNNDGVIDNQDQQFNNIKVWQDLDSNGVVDEGELKNLSEVGIKQINLSNTATNENLNGNQITHRGTFVKADGTTGEVADVSFQINQVFTAYNGQVNISPDVLFLPWLRGYGEVKDLPIAMSENQELKEAVINIAKGTDIKNIYAQLDELIAKWAEIDNIPKDKMRGTVEDRIISAVEKFLGIKYERKTYTAILEQDNGTRYIVGWDESNIPFSEDISIGTKIGDYVIVDISITTDVAQIDKEKILETYTKIKNMIFVNLIAQTEIGKEYGLSYNFVNNSVEIDPSLFYSAILDKNIGDIVHNSYIVKALYDRGIFDISMLPNNALGDFYKSVIYGNAIEINSNEYDPYFTYFPENYIFFVKGSNQGDSIYGGSNRELLQAYEGNDYLSGDLGNDVLIGGKGNDYLEGGEGSDTYIFNLGDGQDTIWDQNWSGTDVNVIKFGKGISKDNIKFTKEGEDLIIKLEDTTDSIRISGWFMGDEYKISKIQFADGTILTTEDIKQIGFHGTNGDDSLQGSYDNDTIHGDAGNDYINGDLGNDVLIGGKGDDYLEGGEGSDTYIFNLGDGNDNIYEYDWSGTDINVIKFGNGITKDNIKFVKEGEDLVIKIENATDSIRISGWFADGEPGIDELQFSDGSKLTSTDIQKIGFHGTDGNDYLYGSYRDDVIYGDKGDDYLEGGEGSDTYVFNLGDGNDRIYDYDWSDTDTNTIRMGTGITRNSVALFSDGYSLFIKYSDTDQITVEGQADPYNGIDTIQLQDGYFITRDDINRIIQEISAFADSNGINITSVDDVRNNQQLMNIIANAWHT
ncbi:calcium-binding protein [Persephonella sp.]